MKRAFTREEVAKFLNFGEYPVLTIDLADVDEYGLIGSPCRIDFGSFDSGEKWYEQADLRVWKDEKTLSFSAHGCCLSSSYTYSDFEKQVKYATAPIIKPESEFVVAIYDSKARALYGVIAVRTGKISRHCQKPIACETVDMSAYVNMAIAKYWD